MDVCNVCKEVAKILERWGPRGRRHVADPWKYETPHMG